MGDVFFNSTARPRSSARATTPRSSTASRSGPTAASWPRPARRSPAQSLGPIGAEFRPTNPSQLFVSNAHAGAGQRHGVRLRRRPRPGCSPRSGPPTPNGQTAPCWVEISHDGRYLFSVNTASATISQLPDQRGRFAGPAGQHAVPGRPGRGRRAALARRQHPLRHRRQRPRRQHLRRRRWPAHRARRIPGRAARRVLADRTGRALTAHTTPPGASRASRGAPRAMRVDGEDRVDHLGEVGADDVGLVAQRAEHGTGAGHERGPAAGGQRAADVPGVGRDETDLARWVRRRSRPRAGTAPRRA